MTVPPVLSLDQVSRRFGDVAAVDRVSFDVARGEFFSLLGPSGCGKTTTLRLIAGFEQPDAGTLRMLGEEMAGRRPYQRPIGMVFQNYALFPHLRVAENVAFGLEERRVPRSEITIRVARALELVRLDPAIYARRRPGELSGGQRQRVALARALVLEPPILLLDEPLGALDLQLRKQMQLELKELNRTLGITFILVTHDQEEALAMSDRIAVMHEGRVVQVGTPESIYEAPRTEFVASFIGVANFFAGTVVQVTDGLADVAGNGGLRWRVPMPSATAAGTAVRVAVRPEWLQLHRDEGREIVGNTFAGTVREIIFLGETLHVLVALRDGSTVRVALRNEGVLANPLAWRANDSVQVVWAPHDARVLDG
ncbi:MAG: ABC transporter ATP-binding protein [Gemmatimonadales bacterium]